jgi:TonB family protein
MSYFQDQNEARFRKILLRCMGFYFAFAAAMTLIPFPHPEKPDFKNLPNRVAKLILKGPAPIPPPIVPEVSKPSEKAATPKSKPEEGKPEKTNKSPSQKREIVMRSGLLGSLNQGAAGKSLSALIGDQKLDQALSSVDLITSSTSQRGRPVIKNALPTKTNLADQKIAHIGGLKKGEQVSLEKGDEVALAPFSGRSSGNGSGHGGDGLGSGISVRLKGSGPGSGNASINYDAISRVVELYKGGLIYLYNKELQGNPTLKGTITVEFSIDGSGRVIEARVVTSSMDYAPLEKALASRIKMWKFPHLYDGIIVVTYPFVFFPV